ncbi:MAG: hypothetical protein R3F43_30275 [bacterium]
MRLPRPHVHVRRPPAHLPQEVTAEARTRAVDCLRGGYRAVLAAEVMRDAICACPDIACASQAAERTTPALVALKDVLGNRPTSPTSRRPARRAPPA